MLRKTLLIGTVCAALVAALPATASNDPHWDKQWGMVRIQAEAAWPTADGTDTVIAIVDTGVDLTHPDLAAKVIDLADSDFVDPAPACTSPKRKACASDGALDLNGHGTHVAGIAAAITGNGVGVAGVAPGARILPVRVLDEDGAGNSADIAQGIKYAADKGADVINLSLTYAAGEDQVAKLLGDVQPIYNAIAHAWDEGAVIVISAGNDSYPLCAEPSPAPNAICVGATDPNDLRAWYSNSDATMSRHFVVAPGGSGGLSCADQIFSTYLRPASGECSTDSGYGAIYGTSMAAPHVSGIAALLVDKGLSNAQILTCLTSTADDLGPPGRDPIYGFGRVNALRAVTNC